MHATSEDVMFAPDADAVRSSQLSDFMRFCSAETGRPFHDHAEFDSFAVAEMPTFWRLLLQWSDLRREGSEDPVCTDPTACEGAVFFPDLRLSYVENVLRVDSSEDAGRTAVVAHHQSGPPDRLTRGELRDRVLRLAAHFERLGLRTGDRVVALARNNAETVIGGLATAAIGATFSSVGADMGASSFSDRFDQLRPKVLMANLVADTGSAPDELADRVGDVIAGLPSLTALVALDDGPVPAGLGLPVHRFAELLDQPPGTDSSPSFKRFPFNHPLFVLFSSGTTGRPKCIIHGAGGTLLEHVKEHRLHVDLRPTDRMFFQTTAAWMMWNWQLSALASGAAIVLYDAPITSADTLWRLVELERVTVFGTSPPYLQLCEDSRYTPREHRDLSALRLLLSTGSILHAGQYDWVRDHVAPIPVQSISGGTDIIGCFVLGNPNLPVYRGAIQCRSLGLDVGALATATTPSDSATGELICRNPFPSRPLGFVDDEDRRRLHDAYYSQNEGVWTHGDLIEIDQEGHVRMHGRSDGILNIHGMRIGPAEIYRVLRTMSEISEAMVVEQQTARGPESARLVLVVVLRQPGSLDEKLVSHIRRCIASEASPAHVPHLVVEADELPRTHNGKRSERALRDALAGVPVANVQSLANPHSLEQIVARVADADAALQRRVGSRPAQTDQPTVERLQAIWEEVLAVAPLGIDDNFFEVGGTSLAAVRVLNAVRTELGVDLPLSTMLHSRTIRSMAAALVAAGNEEFPLHVLLKPGTADRPLFIVHGLFGDVLQFRTLALLLTTDRPVYGLRSRGLDSQAQSHASVEAMAAEFVRHVQRIQATGPYAFAGHSFGGLVAFEMARVMAASGKQVDSLTLIDSLLDPRCLPPFARTAFNLISPIRRGAAVLRARRQSAANHPASRAEPLPPLLTRLGEINLAAHRRYRPAAYSGAALYVEARRRNPGQCNPLPVWRRLIQSLQIESLDCGHDDILNEPCVRQTAALIDADLC